MEKGDRGKRGREGTNLLPNIVRGSAGPLPIPGLVLPILNASRSRYAYPHPTPSSVSTSAYELTSPRPTTL